MNKPLQDSPYTNLDEPQTPPKRAKRFTKRIQRFDLQGHATQEYYDEQARYPAAGEATDRISGVASSTTPSAISKLTLASAFSSNSVRRPERLCDLLRMQRVARAPKEARVYEMRNGRGKTFYQVRYDNPYESGGKRRRGSIYLGHDPDLAAWARDVLRERRWLENRRMPHALDYERVNTLREARRRCLVLAREIATRTNFYFHGTKLRERRNERKH